MPQTRSLFVGKVLKVIKALNVRGLEHVEHFLGCSPYELIFCGRGEQK